jgi:hypothetical protein
LSEEECNKLNVEHKQFGLDILISPNETSNNPGMKEIAKLCLNSLWGKFGQRSNLESYEFYDESKYNVFINRLLSNKIETKGWNNINEHCVEHRFCENDEDVIEGANISEITAIFTTANARMRLYSFLDWLDHPKLYITILIAVSYCMINITLNINIQVMTLRTYLQTLGSVVL